MADRLIHPVDPVHPVKKMGCHETLPSIALLGMVALCFGGLSTSTAAGVIVLANRNDEGVDFSVVGEGYPATAHRLSPHELISLDIFQPVAITFDDRTGQHRYRLDPNTIHVFVGQGDAFDLRQMMLQQAKSLETESLPKQETPRLARLCIIPVKLLVDDEEPMVRRLWEKKLRDRLAAASEIFERHCRVRFEVAAVDTWDTDDRVNDFPESLGEFEREVRPAPGRIAIGFTSQYKLPERRTHLGGTRGPLHSHVLIREWSQHISPSERLEVLVHELAHVLGAAHSAEADSVMRPVLGDRRSNAREFRIGFDPINTLIMSLMSEELRRGTFRGFSRMAPSTRATLIGVYRTLNTAQPDDPAAKNYLRLLGATIEGPLDGN